MLRISSADYAEKCCRLYLLVWLGAPSNWYLRKVNKGQTTREKNSRRNTRTIVIATQAHRDEDGKKVQNCYEDDDECIRMGGARAARLVSRMRINIMFLMTNGENDT